MTGTSTGYINTASVTADPVDTSLSPVDDEDPSSVVVSTNPVNPGNPGSGGQVYSCTDLKPSFPTATQIRCE